MASNSNSTPSTRRSRLAESSYNSPYSRAGASGPHPNTDPYAPLRASGLATLEAMGYDPQTMVERGVLWAEDQDPFGHVMQSQFMQYLGTGFHRVMESYDEFLTEEEYNGMILATTVVPVVRKYELDIRRQVKYPDTLIVAYRQDLIEPTRNSGTTSLFSLQQQAIVAEVKGSVTYIDVKSARPVDIRTLGGGWLKLFEGFTRKAEKARGLKENWDAEHPRGRKTGATSKI
ncbi:hypothetical protein BDV95DRAFT_508618 [Massariosphaeria phaeospora]|uniref:Thioesterase-like superfamily-domain-containing protein n=1 Tax=Massariosphaeria phaeospora TaxID=100035 RepID=A0A7C8I0N8_9PLEO|nr:hypothetical protein BDV95DRAFT_508618 [Massariosphaeria phaeospora]